MIYELERDRKKNKNGTKKREKENGRNIQLAIVNN